MTLTAAAVAAFRGEIETSAVRGRWDAALHTRLTVIIRNGAIEHVFYSIFPPNQHAREVLTWLAAHPAHDVPPEIRG